MIVLRKGPRNKRQHKKHHLKNAIVITKIVKNAIWNYKSLKSQSNIPTSKYLNSPVKLTPICLGMYYDSDQAMKGEGVFSTSDKEIGYVISLGM